MSNDQHQFCRPIVLPDVPGEVTSTTGPIRRKMMDWVHASFGGSALSASLAVNDSIISALRTYATEAVRQDRMGRPLTACDSAIATAAIKTLEGMGYTWNGGELWKPPLGAKAEAPGADGWIEWKGGKCPVPGDTKVDVKLRSGLDTSRPLYGPGLPVGAEGYWWDHHSRDSDSDIVAYRVVKEKAVPAAPTGPTAGQTWFVGFKDDSSASLHKARIVRLTENVAVVAIVPPAAPMERPKEKEYIYRRDAVEFIEKVEG